MNGAMLKVFAVSMPMALHRHWLPSRSEVSTNCTSAMAADPFRVDAVEMAGKVAGVDPAGELRIRQHSDVEGEIGGHTLEARGGNRGAQPRQRHGPIRAVRDDLAQQ